MTPGTRVLYPAGPTGPGITGNVVGVTDAGAMLVRSDDIGGVVEVDAGACCRLVTFVGPDGYRAELAAPSGPGVVAPDAVVVEK